MVDQISRTLGKLEASVEGLQDLIRQQSEESRESRKKIYAKLEEVGLNAQATNARVADLEDRLAKMEPAVSITSGLAWVWAHLPGKHP